VTPVLLAELVAVVSVATDISMCHPVETGLATSATATRMAAPGRNSPVPAGRWPRDGSVGGFATSAPAWAPPAAGPPATRSSATPACSGHTHPAGSPRLTTHPSRTGESASRMSPGTR
jgi:hypothetical protein